MNVKVICCGLVTLSTVTTSSQVGETQVTLVRVLASTSVMFTAASMRRRLELIVAVKTTLLASRYAPPGISGGGEGGDGGGEGGEEGGEGGGEGGEGGGPGGLGGEGGGSIVQYFHAVPVFHVEAMASAQALGWST